MDIQGVKIDFLGHSGFVVTSGNKRIAIDPYNVSEGVEKVDFVFITHGHYDHCSIKDIQKLVKKGTIIITPADAQSKITKIEDVQMEVIEVGDELEFGNGNGFKVEAIAAYNVGKDFHSKADSFVGYLLKIGGLIIYHSGDSDNIPEMQRLSGYGKHGNNFIALLPVSGTYVMTAEEASEVASLLNVDLAIPMHYGAGVVGNLEDAQRFVKLCSQKNINAKILEKI
jgi:L-ascorbate metabolism protein UlaG (beta-lactamase superfamily)